MKKPTITVKQYAPNGNKSVTPSNAIGIVKGMLAELAPTYYPNGNRCYPMVRCEVAVDAPFGIVEQVHAIAGWCERVKGVDSVLSRRAESVYVQCVKFLETQKGFNVTRRIR